MSDCMMFPKYWAKFIEDYSFEDKEEVYTNGSMLIPVFRVEQMIEHYFGRGWIPVTERLPEKWRETDEKYFGDPIEFIVHIAGAECATTLCFDGKDFFDITTGESYTATHWMPLPEPPKEEDQ